MALVKAVYFFETSGKFPTRRNNPEANNLVAEISNVSRNGNQLKFCAAQSYFRNRVRVQSFLLSGNF